MGTGRVTTRSLRAAAIPPSRLRTLTFLATSLAAAAVPLGAQSFPALGIGLGYGSWRISEATTSAGVTRPAVSIQASLSAFMLEGIWASEDGVEPGIGGVLGFLAPVLGGGPVVVTPAVGAGAIHYRADQRRGIVEACSAQPGCFFEAAGIRTGWKGVVALRPSVHGRVGRVSFGPWLFWSRKVAGSGGAERDPSAWGVEVKVRM